MRLIDADELVEVLNALKDIQANCGDTFSVARAQGLMCASAVVEVAPTVNEWIDIKNADDLPSDEVLCCNAFGEIMIGYLKKDKVSCMGVTCEDNNTIMFDAVKWMPLPAPYKGDEDK